MAYLTKTQILGVAQEATAGTYVPTVQTADVDVKVRELTFDLATENDGQGTFLTGDFGGKDAQLITTEAGTASYSIKFAPAEFVDETSGGAGDAEHKLPYSLYLESASLKQEVDGGLGTDLTPATHWFYPSSDNAESTLSLARMVKDKTSISATPVAVESIKGAVSNFTLSVEGSGMPYMLQMESQGAKAVIDDQATIPSFDDDAALHTNAIRFKNTTVVIDELDNTGTPIGSPINFCLSNLALNSNNELDVIECQEDDSAFQNYYVADMNPTLDMNPLLRSLEDWAYWTALTDSVQYRIVIISSDIDDNELAQIIIPNAVLETSNVGDDNGKFRNALSWRCIRNVYGYDPTGLVITNPQEALYFIKINEILGEF